MDPTGPLKSALMIFEKFSGFLRKGGVRVTQNIVKKGPTLITFDIKH